MAAISELSRRYELFAAALASLPLVSILAFVWIYFEGGDTHKLIGLSRNIFRLVLLFRLMMICAEICGTAADFMLSGLHLRNRVRGLRRLRRKLRAVGGYGAMRPGLPCVREELP